MTPENLRKFRTAYFKNRDDMSEKMGLSVSRIKSYEDSQRDIPDFLPIYVECYMAAHAKERQMNRQQ